jgi:hypothetical protein
MHLISLLLATLVIGNYTNNMKVETTVYKPDSCKELLIKVLKFDTEQYFDYMKIDANGNTLALSSGHLVPYNITTDSSAVTVTFTSDLTTTYEGIDLEFYGLSSK